MTRGWVKEERSKWQGGRGGLGNVVGGNQRKGAVQFLILLEEKKTPSQGFEKRIETVKGKKEKGVKSNR